MSFGLTMPSLSRAAASMEIGSLAIRRMSICRDAFALRIEAISAAIRPYSIVELFSSVLDRTSTVEIKDVGSTKVEIPDDAKKKLS